MPTATDTPSANSLTINHRLISKDRKKYFFCRLILVSFFAIISSYDSTLCLLLFPILLYRVVFSYSFFSSKTSANGKKTVHKIINYIILLIFVIEANLTFEPIKRFV